MTSIEQHHRVGGVDVVRQCHAIATGNVERELREIAAGYKLLCHKSSASLRLELAYALFRALWNFARLRYAVRNKNCAAIRITLQ